MVIPKLEKQFEYKGFPCVILFMPTGYRCGYVGIPKDVKIDIDSIGCHGGITYNRDYLYHQERKDLCWIGFDCAHCFDGYDVETAKKLFSDEEGVMKQIDSLEAQVISLFVMRIILFAPLNIARKNVEKS